MVTFRPKKIIVDKFEEQASYTINLDLPKTGLLSTLELIVKARTETTGEEPGPWAKYLISSVSVNQAGQEALNATGPEMFQADYYYKTGKMPMRGTRPMVASARDTIESIPIMFGEKLYDLEHYIDLATLNDPKLSVTYNLATVGSHGKTVWQTTYYPRFSVIAHFIGGAGIPASLGYQSLRQIERYTPVDSQEKMVELKGNRPIKRLYVQWDADEPIYGLRYSIDGAKLWGDNEAYLPFDQKITEWIELIRTLYGICKLDAEVYYAYIGQSLDSCIDNMLFANARYPYEGQFRGKIGLQLGRSVKLEGATFADTHSLPAQVSRVMYHMEGICPWSVQPIDMAKMLGTEYLDPTEHAPMYLELDHASDATTYGGPVKIHVADLVK